MPEGKVYFTLTSGWNEFICNNYKCIADRIEKTYGVIFLLSI